MDWLYYVIIGVVVVAMVAMLFYSSRRNKKQQEEAQNLINAVKPGNKVKTIGGICGIVVEVDLEENTFVLETGTEQTGKCYIKFDRQAIYQTDAVVEKTEEKPAEKKEEQTPVEALPEENLAQTAETPATEETTETSK